MRIGTLICLLVAATACGKKLQAGKTPEETVRNVETAMRKLDLGAVYDMLSTRCQKQLDQQMSGVKAVLCAVPEAQLKQAGLAGVAEMSTREMIAAAADRANDADPNVGKRLKSFQIAILEVKNYGSHATVEVMSMMDGAQSRNDLPMVLEDGRWRIDSEQSLTDLPVDFTPCVPSPAGFT